MRIAILAGAMLCLAAPAADAAVLGSNATGFQLQIAARIAAPPARVWEAVLSPGKWWNSEHTYSSNPGNMTITPTAGGCWCERWAGGQVVHMTVVYVAPQQTLRLRGGLGPLQEMGVDGALTWTVKPAGDGETELRLDYAVGGYSPNGFDGLSRAVDGVLMEQMNRLQLFLLTGHPDARATQ